MSQDAQSNPIQPVLVAGVASAAFCVWRFNEACEPVPPLLFPYMAAAAVFFTACVWIIVTLTPTLFDGQEGSGWKVWFASFLIAYAALAYTGLSGGVGCQAISNLNWVLFQELPSAASNACKNGLIRCTPFNLIAALGNAVAISTMVVIAMACWEAKDRVWPDKAKAPAEACIIRAASRHLYNLLILASTLMVTSTLTVYLLFAVSDQIDRAPNKQACTKDRGASCERQVEPPLPAASEVMPGGSVVQISLPCGSASAGQTAQAQACTLTAIVQDSKDKAGKGSSNAAYMAWVLGLTFTGGLFILFMTCFGAVDGAIEKSMEQAWKTRGQTKDFSLKTWKEARGFSDETATDKLLKILALAAPALTGMLTLLVGA